MVNYCCVYGCDRNSRTSKHLYFYSVPMDVVRSEQWLKAAKREDLLEKPKAKRNLYRFCSRHFSPQNIKNKHLCADAVPTLYLSGGEGEDDSDNRPMHSNIVCNNCRSKIVGFRYKCVTCVDFDLCARCEMAEAHVEHLMLRIPTPIKFKKVENIIKKWQQYHSEENFDDSSDDEPIQKYAKNYDSGIDLSEDIKETIRTEVARVLKVKKSESAKKKTSKSVKRTAEADMYPKKQKMSFVDIGPYSSVPEVVFADVNEIHSNVTNPPINVKNEALCIFPGNSGGSDPDLPVMNLKLTDDMSDLIVFNAYK